MPSVSVGAVEIAYDEAGSGDPVLFVHGTGAAGGDWLPQTNELAERFRCITPDNRDIGSSGYVAEPYAPADMAGDMAGLADHLGLGAAHVVGYSLGGAVVQELAIARSDLVRSLVLVDTWPGPDEMFAAAMRSIQDLRRAHHDDERFLRAFFPWVWSAGTYATPGLVDGIVALELAREPRQRPEGFIRQCEADIAHDARDRLGRVTAPTLVIVGEEDILTPPRLSLELRDLIPQAELVTIPDAAHGAPIERPDVVNAAIAAFLEKH